MSNLNAPPLNPLPPVVWLLMLPVVAFEVAFALGAAGLAGGPSGIGWRLDAVQRFAFSPQYARAMWDQGLWPLDGVMRFLTYAAVHGSVTHAVFVVVFLLALGKFVGEVFAGWAVLVVVLGAAVTGAAVYAAVPSIDAALFGGYPAVYGLIGAFTFILWTNLGRSGANRARAFSLIGMLLAIQLLFGVLFGGGPDWVADLAGFAAGFGLSFVVSPGGWGRVMAKLRER
ncbi:MAG TPA: rhomboid family intramembrane serine protease [Paracoccaceae bacterium]|nr:rhomboid family intramembrane serine protease [Paracoccaceae bacterium]HMO73091.1 rhomboid family intramembrane serine protease [Paracoccaceae bacterium]